MFYTVNIEDERIIDISGTCPDPQKQANYYQCKIYIIDGEHSGLSATPQDMSANKQECRQAADQEKMRRWLEAQGMR